jgi:hypothetical protein
MWLAGSNRTKMLLGSQLYLATQHPLFARQISRTGKFTVYKKDVLFELKCGIWKDFKGNVHFKILLAYISMQYTNYILTG